MHLFPVTESETVSDHLQFMPYLLLLKTLRNYPADNEVGVACRKGVMRERVIHQLLMTLASFGHLPRSRHTVTAPESDRYMYSLCHKLTSHIHHVRSSCTCISLLLQICLLPGSSETRSGWYGIGTSPLLGQGNWVWNGVHSVDVECGCNESQAEG